MDQEIKITANIEPTRPDVCKFVVDRPLYPEGSAYFAGAEGGQGSALAKMLLAIEGIATVRIAGNEVTLAKEAHGTLPSTP